MNQLYPHRSMFFGLVRQLGEGDEFPRFHGYAFRRLGSFQLVSAIVPLNLILGWGMWFWRGLKWGFLSRKPRAIDAEIFKGWHNGYEYGRTVGAREERERARQESS